MTFYKNDGIIYEELPIQIKIRWKTVCKLFDYNRLD